MRRTNFGAPHRIAGEKTKEDWEGLLPRLRARDKEAWRDAVKEYFDARLRSRYFDPIAVLRRSGKLVGEGFAIMAIQCTLIEFLESTAKGTSYRRIRNGERLSEYEYSRSSDVFIDFLTEREPFRNIFNRDSANDFYSNVRCGLLHEARTKRGWRILAQSENGSFVDLANKIVYRNGFYDALLAYVEGYGRELLDNVELQDAFIRKFDSLFER